MRRSSEFASDALARRISDLARTAEPDEVKKLAEALSAIVHGPQGGHSVNYTDYEYASTNRNSTDYHYTTHDGEQRGPVGFVNGDTDGR